jgi:hypothetical protein
VLLLSPLGVHSSLPETAAEAEATLAGRMS